MSRTYLQRGKRFFWYFVCLLTCACRHRDLSEIPVLGYTRTHLPLIEVKISDYLEPVVLDLGSSSGLELPSSSLERISAKVYLGIKTSFGIRGNLYDHKLYQIPEISIAGRLFKDLSTEEQNYEYIQDSAFPRRSLEAAMQMPGKIGWPIFHKTNLLLDFAHDRMFFSKRFEDVKRLGYRLQDFVQGPLIKELELLAADFETPFGTQRLVLDTGSTISLLSAKKVPIECKEEFEDCPVASLFLGGKDVGPVDFYAFALPEVFPADGILGMDFLKSRLVYIDWENLCLYIACVDSE